MMNNKREALSFLFLFVLSGLWLYFVTSSSLDHNPGGEACAPVFVESWDTIVLDGTLCQLTFDFWVPFIIFVGFWIVLLFLKYWFDFRKKS